MSAVGTRWDRERPGCAVDRYGRDAARCRAEAQAAAAHAEAVRRVVDAIEDGTITLGREAGAKLVRRFLLNAAQLDGIAERDLEHAAELELAESEEHDKLAAYDAVRAERLRRVAGQGAGGA